MKKTILTGDRPTGKLHLGHYVGSLKNRIKMQDKYDCYFIIADYQVLTDQIDNIKNIAKNIREIVLDYLSVGIDPKKSTIFVESEIPEIPQLDLIFSMLTTLNRVKRNPTIKEQIQTAGIKQASLGYISWPVTQAADILSVRADIVPVGKDQVPHIELTREIARTFNYKFKKVFPEPEGLVGETPTLPGLDGQKMSKSRNNAIYLSDSKEQIEEKIIKAVTDPKKIHLDDKGHPEKCNIYQYYKAFFPEKAQELKKECQNGKIGCVQCKKDLAKLLNEFLQPIRDKRKEFEKKPDLIKEILEQGRIKTQKRAKETLDLVKEAMEIGYHY
jgi:tryptophanyl-tRNA synthetase